MSQIVSRKQYSTMKTGTAAKTVTNRSGAPAAAAPKANQQQRSSQRIQQKKDTGPNQRNGQISESWNSEVVYLEATEPEQNNYGHPVEVGKALTDKGIRKIKDIQQIGRFRFKITFETAKEATPLVLTNLEDVGLRIYVPHIEKEIIGLAKGVPLRYSEAEIFENLQVAGEVISVERMKRKSNQGNLVDTKMVRIKFKGKALPETAVLYGWRFVPELYIFPMKQCKNCWRFGHKTGACRKNTKCANCGNTHDSEVECAEQTSCLNCGGNHRSDDRRCPERKKQMKVNEAVQKRRITQQEANELLARRDPRHENQFDLLRRYEEFPELAEDNEHEMTNAWRGGWKPHQGRKNNQRKGARRRRRSSLSAGSETTNRRDDTSRDRTEIGKLTRKVEELGKRINVIGRIIRLQKGVEEECQQQQDETSMEALIIRINTVLKEIVTEFGKNITETENHTENENNNNSRNGQEH